jgi:ABC-2 type transport system permease protein
MNALLRAEILKLRTLRSSWLVLLAAVVISAGYAFALVKLSRTVGITLTSAQVASAPAQAMWFLAIGLAIVATAGEFGHKTIRTTLLLSPGRGRVLAAKAVVAAGAGAFLALLGAATAAVTGKITAIASGIPLPIGIPTTWTPIAASAGVAALWAVIASGLGVLTRSTAITIAAVLLWRFVGENLLPNLATNPEHIARWTPFGASNAVLGAPNLFPVWAAALLLAGYAALAALTAARVFSRLDVA